MELREAVQLLRDFLSPSNTKFDQKVNVNEVTLANLLQANIDTFKSKHEDAYQNLCDQFDAESDVYWKIAQMSLSLIENLNNCRFEVNPNGCYLSITDEALVSNYCQFIACFGIHYNLQDDIGVSIERLSKYGANIVKKRVEIDYATRNQRLEYCLTRLMEIKDNRREHFNFIEGNLYRKHLHDLICSLIQLCHSPESQLAMESSDGKRERFQKWLESELFEVVDGSMIVSNLLMAQSSIKPMRLQQKGQSEQRDVVWFVRVVGNLLTKCLMRPNSVMNVIRAVLSEMSAVSASANLASDWKKCDLVAKILAQCPRHITSDDYVKFISPQILKLFFEYDPRFARHFYRVAGSIYSLFALKWPELTRVQITNQILSTFHQYLSLNKPAHFQMSEASFIDLVDKVHLVYVSSTEPNWQTLQQLPIQLIHLLFKVYCLSIVKQRQNKLSEKMTKTKDLIYETLKLYIRMMPNQDNSKQSNNARFLVDMIKCKRIHETAGDYDCKYCIPFEAIEIRDDEEEATDAQELPLINMDFKSKPESKKLDKAVSKGMQAFLKALNDTELNMNLLFCLFQTILESYQPTSDSGTSKALQERSAGSLSSDKTLLSMEQSIIDVENSLLVKAIYYKQVANLFEIVDPELIMNESDKVLDFCRKTIEYMVDIIKNSTQDIILGEVPDDESQSPSSILKDEYETIHMILSILSIFTTGVLKVDEQVKKKLQYFLPPLYEIREIYTDTDLASLAHSLYVTIANFGGIDMSHLKINPDQYQNTEDKEKHKKPLIEVLDDDDDQDEVKENEPLGVYERALRDINDPLLPVKAHGLVELRRLVEKKAPECCHDLEKVIEIFMKHIKNDDSYVYLAAINGLIALTTTHFSDRPSSSILDTLIDHFSNQSNDRLTAENKLKIGESLTRTIRNYNDLVPAYAPKLLHMFLIGCKNDDELIRASSLSNMGETCKLLKYSLQSYIYEILNCLSSLLEHDKSIEVRRSAIMVLKMILEGLKDENFLHVLGDSIAPLYRLLSKTKTIANDNVIKLECQLAMEYLNEFMKESLFPKQKLEKVIQI